MKKFITGVVVGAIIASTLPAYGAVTSMIGQEVDGQKEVKLNGKTVGTAIIVDNKSYLPVRDTANAFGATVAASKGAIDLSTLSKEDAQEFVRTELETLYSKKSFLEKQIEKSLSTIKNLEEVVIPKYEQKVANPRNEIDKADSQRYLDKYKQSLADEKQKLADYQSQLDAINARIAELEGN